MILENNPNGSNVDISTLAKDATLKDGTQKSQIVDLDGHVANVQNLQTDFAGNEYALITQSIIHGKTTGGGGGYRDVKVSPSGALTVEAEVSSSVLPTGAATSELQNTANNSLSSIDTKLNSPVKIKFSEGNLSPFGNLIAVDLEPIFQSDFVYGLNTQNWNTGVVSGTGAIVDTNTGRLRVQSGTANNGYAYITSRKLIKYRAGQGIVVRFTPMFTNVLTNNTQLQGVGYIANNLPFDGYFFSIQSGSFGIAHYNNGSLASFTPQSSWNGDKCNGTGASAFNWDITKGVPCQIVYPYLGYGNIMFFVQNPLTSELILCHVIQYSNTSASTQISNASLQFISFVLNSGNTTNLILYTGSVGAFIAGKRSFVANPRWAWDVVNKQVTSTESNVLSIRNATTYNGIANRGLIRLTSLSVGSSSNPNCVLRLKINATVGGTPVFTTINGTTANNGVTITNGNSIASYDTAGTTITGGTYIWNISIGSSGSNTIDLTDLDLYIAPGETATFCAIASANTNFNISVNWTEDI